MDELKIASKVFTVYAFFTAIELLLVSVIFSTLSTLLASINQHRTFILKAGLVNVIFWYIPRVIQSGFNKQQADENRRRDELIQVNQEPAIKSE